MNNLRLKSEVKTNNQDIVIYKRIGGKNVRCKFPINTPQSEYINYYNQGFRIFRCDECGSDTCDGDHMQIIKVDGEDRKIHESISAGESNMELKANIEAYEKGLEHTPSNLEDTEIDLIRVSGEVTTEFSIILKEQTDEELIQMIDELGLDLDYVNDYVREDYVKILTDEYNKQGESPQAKPDYQGMKLKELREMFPDIKATSKDDFISQIK